MHALRHIHERATGPCSSVQRTEFVVFRRYHGAEILLDEFGVFTHCGIGVDEDYALLFQVLANRVVNHLGFVLGSDAGDQTVLLGFGDAESVVGGTNVIGQVVPAFSLLLNRLDVILEIIGIETRQIHTPIGHGLVEERLETAQTHVEHPLRLALVGADGAHDVFVYASFCGFAGGVGIMPAVAVIAELADDLVILLDLVLVDASTIGHILAHLHVSGGVWCCVFGHHPAFLVSHMVLRKPNRTQAETLPTRLNIGYAHT